MSEIRLWVVEKLVGHRIGLWRRARFVGWHVECYGCGWKFEHKAATEYQAALEFIGHLYDELLTERALRPGGENP